MIVANTRCQPVYIYTVSKVVQDNLLTFRPGLGSITFQVEMGGFGYSPRTLQSHRFCFFIQVLYTIKLGRLVLHVVYFSDGPLRCVETLGALTINK